MTMNMFAVAAPLALTLTACGISAKNSASTSKMKHVPVKGFSVCESEVFIQGDPHAKVYAQRAIFLPDLKEVTIIGYEARAMDLSVESDIFNEGFQRSNETFDIALKPGTSTAELFTKEEHKAVGSIEPSSESIAKVVLNLRDERETLNCRRSGQ